MNIIRSDARMMYCADRDTSAADGRKGAALEQKYGRRALEER
jgi:hypothetical protein